MTKRRRANELMFKSSHRGFKPGGGLRIAVVPTGTGTVALAGVVTVVAASVATQAYMTLAATTNIGTLVGTAAVTQ